MNRYFEKAKQAAKISDFKNVHIGCIAVYQNQVIGIGCNSNKTHPKQKYYNKFRNLTNKYIEPMPKIHAEIMCINSISKLNIDFSKVDLYIYRIRKDIPHGLCRPCEACMKAIKDIGIKNIHYTTDDSFIDEKLF